MHTVGVLANVYNSVTMTTIEIQKFSSFMKFPYAYLSLDIQTLNVKYEKHLCQGTKKIFGEDLQGLLVCRTKLEKEEKL